MTTESPVYGIDRVISRFYGNAQITLPVSGKTLKTWRREDPKTALARLIKKAGGQAKLGEMLGVAQRTVSHWLAGDQPPGYRAHNSDRDHTPRVEPANEVERAVRAAGGQPKVAALFGVTQQCVSGWCKKGYMPPGRAQEMEMQTGVPRTELINPKLRNTLGVGGEL